MPRYVNSINIQNMENVYDIQNTKSGVKSDISYIKIEGAFLGSQQSILLIDDGTMVPYSIGRNRLSLMEFKRGDLKKIKKIDMAIKSIKESVYRIVPEYSIDELLGVTNWETFVRDTVLDGCIKDEIIVNLTYPNFITTPLEFQGFNHHTLLLTGTKVGKTEIIRSVGLEPVKDVTTAGLLGTYSRTTGYRSGVLEGKGSFLIDEITQETKDDRGDDFSANLLTYMEQGEVQRAIEGRPFCKGSKNIIFTGNVDKGDLMKSTELAVQRLSGRYYPQRFGSRLAMILLAYSGELVEVNHDNANDKETREKNISMVRNCLFYVNTDNIIRVYESIWKVRDESLRDYVKVTYPFINNVLISSFISGLSSSNCDIRLRLMAFKTAIVMCLQDFLRLVKDKKDLYDKELYNKLELYTTNYYSLYREYLKWSIDKLYDIRLKKAYELDKAGFPQEEIAKQLNVSQGTVSNWVKLAKTFFRED